MTPECRLLSYAPTPMVAAESKVIESGLLALQSVIPPQAVEGLGRRLNSKWHWAMPRESIWANAHLRLVDARITGTSPTSPSSVRRNFCLV